MEQVMVIHGNEACVRGALAAGCRFLLVPHYPCIQIAELMAEMLPKHGGIFMQMDEIASICSLIGATWGDSRRALRPRGQEFSLMQEGRVRGSETLCDHQCAKGGPSTGQPTCLRSRISTRLNMAPTGTMR